MRSNLLLFTLLALSINAADGQPIEIYASPTGSGSVGTLANPCSLEGARDLVRTLNNSMIDNIHVYLRGGHYHLATTFALTANDSGQNGYKVIYQPYNDEVPVISGGTVITGWSLHDSSKNIYSAYVGSSLNTRQLFVNERRALRARGITFPNYTTNSVGYTHTTPVLATWGNPEDMEIVDAFQFKHYRLPIASISSTVITVENRAWTNFVVSGNNPNPHWLENAYELLDAEGEWYLNRATGYIFYKPRKDEDLSTALVIAPNLDTLITGVGAIGNPIHDIEFRGLTFSYGHGLAPTIRMAMSESRQA